MTPDQIRSALMDAASRRAWVEVDVDLPGAVNYIAGGLALRLTSEGIDLKTPNGLHRVKLRAIRNVRVVWGGR